MYCVFFVFAVFGNCICVSKIGHEVRDLGELVWPTGSQRSAVGSNPACGAKKIDGHEVEVEVQCLGHKVYAMCIWSCDR